MNYILCVLALSFQTNKPNKCVQQCFEFGSINQCPACKWDRWSGAHSNQHCTGKAGACGKEERRSSLLLSEKLLSVLSFKEPDSVAAFFPILVAVYFLLPSKSWKVVLVTHKN